MGRSPCTDRLSREPAPPAALALSLCSWESPEGRWAPGMVGGTERQPSGKGNEASSGGSSQPGGRCCAPRSGFTRWGLGDWHNSQRRGVTLSRTASGFWKRLPSGAGGAAVGRSRVRPEGVSLEARPAPLQGPALRCRRSRVSLGKSLYVFKAKLPWLRRRAGNRPPRRGPGPSESEHAQSSASFSVCSGPSTNVGGRRCQPGK